MIRDKAMSGSVSVPGVVSVSGSKTSSKTMNSDASEVVKQVGKIYLPLIKRIFNKRNNLKKEIKKVDGEIIALKVKMKKKQDLIQRLSGRKKNKQRLILQSLRRDLGGKHCCIQMLDQFVHKGHLCISLPLMGVRVFNFMEQNDYYPYSLH